MSISLTRHVRCSSPLPFSEHMQSASSGYAAALARATLVKSTSLVLREAGLQERFPENCENPAAATVLSWVSFHLSCALGILFSLFRFFISFLHSRLFAACVRKCTRAESFKCKMILLPGVVSSVRGKSAPVSATHKACGFAGEPPVGISKCATLFRDLVRFLRASLAEIPIVIQLRAALHFSPVRDLVGLYMDAQFVLEACAPGPALCRWPFENPERSHEWVASMKHV